MNISKKKNNFIYIIKLTILIKLLNYFIVPEHWHGVTKGLLYGSSSLSPKQILHAATDTD